jgi:hypothetical protein
MDNPLAQLSPQQLAQNLAQLPKVQQQSLLATLLKRLSTFQLYEILSSLSQPKLLALITKLLTCLDRDRLTQLVTQVQAELDALQILETQPASESFSVVAKTVQGKRYVYARNPSRTLELSLGRLYFEMGRIYQLRSRHTSEVKHLRCLRIYIPHTLDPTADRQALIEVEWLNPTLEVTAAQTYAFPQCMKAELSVEDWQITELASEQAIAPSGRLDHPQVTPHSAQIKAHLNIPPDRAPQIAQTLQRWIDLSATSTRGRWHLVESSACTQRTLLNGQSQALLTYAYKDHQVLLLIPPEALIAMLKHLCKDALNSSSRTHQELARPLLTHLKVSKYTPSKDVIEYTLIT